MAQSTNYIKSIEKLFRDSRVRAYPKNQLIHYQGDPLSHIYLIKSGYIKAYTILDSGDTRTILILGPGDIFPLAFSSSLDWENYQIHYFYQTLSEVKVATLTSDVLRDYINNNAEAMSVYMNYIAASNEAIMHQLEAMKNKKAIDKLTMLLPYLVSKAGKKIKADTYELQLKLSHQEIADLSGVTRETTTSLIKQLEQEGVIDQHRGKWLINTKNLATVSGAG
ncbi:MAG TPA: Crp/Fnr family transcriptional regulator [Candidatus Saccharimonadales bacterium]|nr:Crp/Fnr family transcriptional regulator [Candidatus Saccharimonadales bacterium]